LVGSVALDVAMSYISSKGLTVTANKLITSSAKKITKNGISKVEQHLATMDFDVANQVMVARLKQIEQGTLKATIQDVNFYKHELLEKSYVAKGMSYEAAHVKALAKEGIKYEKGYQSLLYTDEALEAGDDYFRLGN